MTFRVLDKFIQVKTVSAAHPNTLRATDFNTILSSDQLFARKFDEAVDTEIMDLIDSQILWKAQPKVKDHYITDNEIFK